MPGIMEREFGRVVTISSNIAMTGRGGASFVTYGASKAGLIALTKGIAHEGAPYITANAICPAMTLKEIAVERGDPWPPPPPEGESSVSWLGISVPLNRKGYPEDIAEAVLFFAGDSGCFLTGQTIQVSGGLMMP